ncbi:hypothetical protein Tco_0543317 [Tanacetum coccineum]
MGKENMKDPVPHDLPPMPFLGHLEEQIGSPYRTLKTVCMIENPREVHKMKDQEDERGMDAGWDITIKDVERLTQLLTPTIHTLPNLESVDYDIPPHGGVVQPLTPQTVHITPLDDDYVASATNLILDKRLNEFGEEFSDITMVVEKANDKELSDVPAVKRQILRPSRPVTMW